MKKLFLVASLALMSFMTAQTSTYPALAKDGFTLGVNSTGINFVTAVDSGVKRTNLGVEGGYFVADKLAAVAGVGYTNTSVKSLGTVTDVFNYTVGAKYYLQNVIPLQVDLNGDDNNNEYVGFQAGYAFFASPNFSIEPRARYDIALDGYNRDVFSLGLGFNYFFK